MVRLGYGLGRSANIGDSIIVIAYTFVVPFSRTCWLHKYFFSAFINIYMDSKKTDGLSAVFIIERRTFFSQVCGGRRERVRYTRINFSLFLLYAPRKFFSLFIVQLRRYAIDSLSTNTRRFRWKGFKRTPSVKYAGGTGSDGLEWSDQWLCNWYRVWWHRRNI